MNTKRIVKMYKIETADNAAELIDEEGWQPWGSPFAGGAMRIEGKTYHSPSMQAIVIYED